MTWEDIRRAEMLRAIEDVLRRRAYMAPIGLSVMTLLFWYEDTAWRRTLIAIAVSLMVTVVVVEEVRARRRALGEAAAVGNAAVMLVGLFLAMAATGGIESPVAPALLLMTVLAGVLGSASAARRIWVAAVLGAVGFTAAQALDLFPDAVPRLFGGPAHTPVPALVLAQGLGLVTMTSGVYMITSRVRLAFERMAERADAAGRAAVDGMADDNRTLALLTGEIAHELKNPLASVKGLAGLVAKDLDGKAATRMAVLRREVDRMQETLEQFLTLSRPVVPLAVAPLDPRALCEEVAALHEGVAADRGVRIDVSGSRGLALTADARKLTQVLTNLVQNALAASPRGATIVIDVVGGGDGVTLRVLDRGTGLADAIAARVFDPGVTTKPDGSGLGLAIARSLARQHGGELELAARDGGGVTATVTLRGTP